MINIFQQQEWRGIARESTSKKDPFTSHMELNTAPGRDRLVKIPSTAPLLAEEMPLSAFYFSERGQYFAAMDETGAYPNFGFNGGGEEFRIGVTFRWDGQKRTDQTKVATILSALEGDIAISRTSWAIRIFWSSGRNQWEVQCDARDSPGARVIMNLNYDIKPGVWYFLRFEANNSVSQYRAFLFIEGSQSAVASATDSTYTRTAFYSGDNYVLSMGGTKLNYEHTLFHGAIAEVVVNGGTVTPGAFQSHFPIFLHPDRTFDPSTSLGIMNPRSSIHPGFKSTNPTATETITWVPHPRPGITQIAAPPGHLFPAKGLYSFRGNSYELHLHDPSMFRQRTVFLFLADLYDQATLLRSDDAAFQIHWKGTVAADAGLRCIWTPKTQSAGLESLCRQAVAETETLSFSGAPVEDEWLAVETIPDTEGGATAYNLLFWRWATTAWAMVSATSASTLVGGGIEPPNATRWILGETTDGMCHIYDFRVVVGDDAWKTNHTPDSITTSIPAGVLSWLNTLKDGTYPGDDNVRFATLSDSGDLSKAVIGIGDRVDGVFRYRSNPAIGTIKYTGCPAQRAPTYLPSVEDIHVAPDGEITALCDSYYYEDGKAKPLVRSTTTPGRRLADVGQLKYVVGPAPLQLAAPVSRQVGLPVPVIYCAPGKSEAEVASTIADNGDLEYDTTYKVKCTLYDPITGNESNPHGPFRFTTDTGTGHCGFALRFSIASSVDVAGLHLRVYRFVEGTGTYHLEGASNISGYEISGSRQVCFGNFTCAMDEDDLVLQKALELDNYAPPEHTFVTIWGHRAWYVDAINPSRLYYSKEDFFGQVPPGNVLWTDEGVTGAILGAVVGFGGLILLKERSLWVIPQAMEEATMACEPLVPDVGCVSGSAAVFANGILWWASPGGIYAFDGNAPVSYSERLEGVDRHVWSSNPRATRCWHDARNFRVVFVCDGAAVAIDTRTGAASLMGLPYYCAADSNTPEHTGTVYGGDGMVWKEVEGTKGQILNAAGEHSAVFRDEFDDVTEQVFRTTDGALDFGWSLFNASALAVGDVNTTHAEKMYLELTSAHSLWSGATTAGAFIYKLYGGDFDVFMEITSFDTVGDYIGVGLMAYRSSVNRIAIRATNDAHPTEPIGIYFISVVNNVETTYFLSRGAGPVSLRLVREGRGYTLYYKLTPADDWQKGPNPESHLECTRTDILDVTSVGIFTSAVAATYGTRAVRIDYFDQTHPATNCFGPIDATNAAPILWPWHDGVDSGEKAVGISYHPTYPSGWVYFQTAMGRLYEDMKSWQRDTSIIGRQVTHWNTATGRIWTATISGHANSVAYGLLTLKVNQPLLAEYFFDVTPVFYRSNDITLGRKADGKVIQRMDFVTGELEGGGTAHCMIGACIHEETTPMFSSGTSIIDPNSFYQIPARVRGYRFFWELAAHGGTPIPEVKELRIHFRPIRPRGRVR